MAAGRYGAIRHGDHLSCWLEPYRADARHDHAAQFGVASANASTVTVTFPNAPILTLNDAQTIQWTGSDADGDPLTYNILYSRDNGATWIGVASGITTTSSVLDFAEVPGSSNSRIKVQVSDGFNSAEDVG